MNPVSFIVVRCVCCSHTWIAGRYPVTAETLAALTCPECRADVRHIALPEPLRTLLDQTPCKPSESA